MHRGPYVVPYLRRSVGSGRFVWRGRGDFFFVSSFIACDLCRSWQSTNARFPATTVPPKDPVKMWLPRPLSAQARERS